MPIPKVYARASLLDRLLDREHKNPEEKNILIGQTRKEFLASLHRDLSWLLNTRCPLGMEELGDRERSVVDYGVPDFGTFYSSNAEDRTRLASILKNTITAYEPRLRDVQIILEWEGASEFKTFHGSLEARLVIGEINEPLTFPIVVDNKRRWEIRLSSNE